MPKRISPNQFKLFMTGTEWQASVTKSTDGPLEHVWPQKTSEARQPGPVGVLNPVHGGGLRDAIATEGYKHDREDPPTIILEQGAGSKVHHVQSEGHHRIAAAADVERTTGKPTYIPTNYVDNTPAGRRARNGGRHEYRAHG